MSELRRDLDKHKTKWNELEMQMNMMLTPAEKNIYRKKVNERRKQYEALRKRYFHVEAEVDRLYAYDAP